MVPRRAPERRGGREAQHPTLAVDVLMAVVAAVIGAAVAVAKVGRRTPLPLVLVTLLAVLAAGDDSLYASRLLAVASLA